MTAPDRQTWEHATETVALLGAAALAAVAVLPGTGVPGWAIWGIELLGGAVAALTIWSSTGSALFSCYALSVGAFLGTWSAWALHRGLWHAAVIVIWLGGLIVLGPAGALACRVPGVPEYPDQEVPEEEEEDELANFTHMFSEIDGCGGVEAVDITEERSGRVVRLQLPRTGRVTMANLEAVSTRIEVILHLKRGAVDFYHASHSGDVVMRLRERNVLASKIFMKPEHQASTINKPFAIGVCEDGSLAMFTLRELHVLIAGTTGSGKSNLNNVIVGQLARCVDTIIWMIDMKGGRTARPWLQPWIEGKAGAPVLDWVATTRSEAEAMMKAFVKAIDVRANSGIGGSKIIPSASMPQIILICDEMADLFGALRGTKKDVGEDATNSVFIRLAEEVAQKGRSEAGASVWATQRATVTMAGSGDLKANLRQRIALAAATEGDLRSIIPDARNAQKLLGTLASERGTGVMAMGRQASMIIKFFYADHPEDPKSETGDSLCDTGCVPACPVYKTAVETGGIRPRLDQITADGIGDVYAERWSRAGNLLKRGLPAGGTAVADVDISQFEDIMRGGGVKDPEARLNPARRRAREILGDRGAMGATPGYLMSELEKEDLAVARETLQRWLAADAREGLVHNADFGRWKIGPAKRDQDAA